MRLRGLLLVLVGVVVLLWVPAGALAAKEFVPTGLSFGGAGSADGQFLEPAGVAVNDSAELGVAGDVYVVDRGDNRVERFSSAGAFVAAWGWGVADGQAKYEVCTSGCRAGTAGSGEGQLEGAAQIAVDNSGNALDPSLGNVFVESTGDNVIERFSATGEYMGVLTGTCAVGPCTGEKAFGELHGLATDPAGNVWVYEGVEEGQRVDEFGDTGAFVKSFKIGRGIEPGLAVNASGGVYVLAGSAQVVEFDSATGEEVAEFGEGFRSIAVDPSTGDVVADRGGAVELYGPAGEPLSTPASTAGLSESAGVAVSGTGLVYASDRAASNVEALAYRLLPGVSSEAAAEVTTTEATLHGTVNPEGLAVSGCRFEFGSSTAYGQSVPCTQTSVQIGTGTEPVAVSAEVTGLQPGATYHFRLRASNANGVGSPSADESFLMVPAVTEEASTNTTSTEAKVTAKIDASGTPTTYRVEYGLSEGYGSSTPEVSIGAPQGAVSVAAQLVGLSPGTTYHFRFLATSRYGRVPGADATFRTVSLAAAAPGLPDGRGYELVSGVGEPEDVFVPWGPTTVISGTLRISQTKVPFRAAADGETVVYPGDPAAVGGNGYNSALHGDEMFAVRDPRQGRWDVSDITPTQATEARNPSTYNAFSSSLSVGVFSEPGFGPAFPGAEGPAGCPFVLYSHPVSGGDRALFTETQTPGYCGELDLQFAGGNAGAVGVGEYSRLLFQTRAALTVGGHEAPEGEGRNLYESVAGQLHPVNVLPDGVLDPNAVFGGPPGDKNANGDFSDVISTDGSRVFWADLATHGLYVREDPESSAARTVQLDTAQAGATGPSGGGLFWTATADGSKVFFTDCARLTADSTAVSGGGCEHRASHEPGGFSGEHWLLTGNDLYEYDFSKPEGERLTDLTVDPAAGDPLGADVQGVVGASADGSYVYFVAAGALAPGAEEHNCREPGEELDEKDGKGEPISAQERERLLGEEDQERLGDLPHGRGCNLYLEHAGEPLRFIATLAPQDDRLRYNLIEGFQAAGVWQRSLGLRTAEVTASGHQLVFESTRHLTGYDNSLLGEEQPERGAEVFVYDATPGPAGRLFCASCDPRNALPTPETSVEQHATSGTYLQASLNPTALPRWISEDGGRVFFDTSQPLVPQDVNSKQDVYEWEHEGTAGCPVATSVYGGCVFLLSGGDGDENSYFTDADATGDNVFFIHRGGLGQAAPLHEVKLNMFDARVGGGFTRAAQGCAGGGCQSAPPASPAFSMPSSATFAGAGNFSPPTPAVAGAKRKPRVVKCRRGFVKRHTVCVRKKVKKKARAGVVVKRRVVKSSVGGVK